MQKRILIIEDDKDLAAITGDMLQNYGYEIQTAPNCEYAFDILTHEQFHLLLVDINLPDGSGFDVCRELRRVSKVPVIFASARTSEDDKIRGLDMGGDDYLAKPYSLRELLARINALMRRTYGAETEAPVYAFGNIKVNTGTRTVERGGEEVRLALREFDLLAYLCAHPNKAIRKEELLFRKRSLRRLRFISDGCGKNWRKILRRRSSSRRSGASGISSIWRRVRQMDSMLIVCKADNGG